MYDETGVLAEALGDIPIVSDMLYIDCRTYSVKRKVTQTRKIDYDDDS